MNKKIIDRLAFLIDSIYPEIPFCDKQDLQDVEPPRFFITCYRTELTPRIQPAGFFYTSNFDLTFDPGSDNPEERSNEVAFTLSAALQKIPREDGTNFRSDNINTQYDSDQGILHIFFDVTTTLHEPNNWEEDPDIKHIQHTTEVEVV